MQPSNWRDCSAEPVLNAESAARVGPLDIAKLVADDATAATLDTTLVGKHNPTVVRWNVAIGWATVDALLPYAMEADIVIDDANVRSRGIDVVGVERQLALNRRRVVDPIWRLPCAPLDSW
jgi:hypothetical protein